MVYLESSDTETIMSSTILKYSYSTCREDRQSSQPEQGRSVGQFDVSSRLVSRGSLLIKSRPVVSNRFGTAILLNVNGSEKQRISFNGRSFITDNTGAKVTDADIDKNPITIN